MRTGSKHLLISLYYSNKRKTYRCDLKNNIKIYDVKIIYESIFVYNCLFDDTVHLL